MDYTVSSGGCYIYVKHTSLQKPLLANGYLSGPPILEFVSDAGWRARNASIIAPSGQPICQVRKGSTFKFSYGGRDYRWVTNSSGFGPSSSKLSWLASCSSRPHVYIRNGCQPHRSSQLTIWWAACGAHAHQTVKVCCWLSRLGGSTEVYTCRF